MTAQKNKFYYISSGAKNAMRTLRSVISVPGVYFRDEYICNLARDYDEAVEKARERIGTEAELKAQDFDLNEWGKHGGQPMKKWMVQQIEQVELGYMPFGKHRGEKIADLPETYVKYWVSEMASNAVGQVLIQKFTDIANERGYFEQWEQEEKDKETARIAEAAKSNYVGNVKDRMVFFLRCDKRLAIDGHYGAYYMNICKDRYGNEFVYAGSNAWQEGKYYKIKATIKAHREYKGKKQNFISRPTIIKTVEKETA
jgi:uncharacterized protein (DUF3820 family)